MADQGLSSITNLALAVVIARTLPVEEFGAFSLAFAAYVLVVGMSRSLASEPLVVRYSAVDHQAWARGTAAAAGLSIAVGVAVGIPCLVVGVLLEASVQQVFVVLGIALPALLLQDVWRYAFFARSRGVDAFLNDLVWTLCLVLLLIASEIFGLDSVVWLTSAWAAAGTIAAACGTIQARVVPRPFVAVAWIRTHFDLAPRYLAEFATMTGAAYLSVFAIAAVAGLSATGALRAAAILLAPVNTILLAVALFGVPESVRLLRLAPETFRKRSALLSAGLAGLALAWGAVVLVGGSYFGPILLRSTWDAARPVIVPLAIALAGSGAAAGAFVGLRALAAADRSLKVRLLIAPLVVTGALLGGVANGATGAAWGFAAANWLGALAYWRYFAAALEGMLEIRRVGAARPEVMDTADAHSFAHRTQSV